MAVYFPIQGQRLAVAGDPRFDALVASPADYVKARDEHESHVVKAMMEGAGPSPGFETVLSEYTVLRDLELAARPLAVANDSRKRQDVEREMYDYFHKANVAERMRDQEKTRLMGLDQAARDKHLQDKALARMKTEEGRLSQIIARQSVDEAARQFGEQIDKGVTRLEARLGAAKEEPGAAGAAAGAPPATPAEEAAERVVEQLSQPFQVGGRSGHVVEESLNAHQRQLSNRIRREHGAHHVTENQMLGALLSAMGVAPIPRTTGARRELFERYGAPAAPPDTPAGTPMRMTDFFTPRPGPDAGPF